MGDTTLIDCTATFEEDGAAKVLACSSIKVGAAKGTPWSTGQVPVGEDGYAMVTICPCIKNFGYNGSYKPGGARPESGNR
jgi:hypothetical protein